MDKYSVVISDNGVRVRISHPNVTISGHASWNELGGIVRRAIKKRKAIKHPLSIVANV